jgi:hypothetical protein
MALHWAVRSAIEWAEASGPRTQERLAQLVRHYGGIYGLSEESMAPLIAEARAEIGHRWGLQGAQEEQECQNEV